MSILDLILKKKLFKLKKENKIEKKSVIIEFN
jgi:hypothetical protein